jgi:spermidine/putrescine transport system substrate-binding protein
MRSSERGTRKAALIVAALVAAATLALGLAACGGGDSGGIEGGGEKQTETVKLEGKPSGSLTISNWPLYIDKATVPAFEKESDVTVKYIEDVNDNAEFFGKVQPLLAQGEAGGRSIFVVTDWMANKMHELGYLQDFDQSGLPEFEQNLRDELKSPSYDPDRAYSAPWQSGMTGLTVRTDLAPDVRSICDLFDPQYKGKVEMLTEMRDTVPLVMKCLGVDPDEATEGDWLDAIDKIQGAVEDGQIRRFTGNDYARDLTSGDAVAVIGWSGDAVQLQADNPDIEWRMPTEGCILWSDNMVIPVGAPNGSAAEAWIDYVYEPEVQADIAEYVNYVTPVDGVKEILAQREPELAKNQLIFPSESFTKNCTIQPTPTGEEEQKITAAFEAVLNQ